MMTKNFLEMLKNLTSVGVYEVNVVFLEESLGTQPNDPAIMEKFIASKAPDAQTMKDELENTSVNEIFDRQTTVFRRDENGQIYSLPYQWKGMFKDMCGLLKRIPGTKSSAVKAYKKIIDGCIFIYEDRIPFIVNDNVEPSICQRPLRASTAQGERIALAASEALPAGTKCRFHLILMNKNDLKLVKEWLNYGCVHGFSQWRNSGKGSLNYKINDVTDDFLNNMELDLKDGF